MSCFFLIFLNHASIIKIVRVRKTVGEGRSVNLQIESDKIFCEVFSSLIKHNNLTFFNKKKRKGNQAFPLSLSKSNFITDYNWNCIANMPVFLSTPLSWSASKYHNAVILALKPSIT